MGSEQKMADVWGLSLGMVKEMGSAVEWATELENESGSGSGCALVIMMAARMGTQWASKTG
jgi:hypothetical protein